MASKLLYDGNGWSPAFQDPETERRYRLASLSADRLVLLMPVILVNVSSAVFASTDLDFTGGGSAFQRLLLLRIALVCLSLMVVLVLWRGRSVPLIDGVVFGWTLFVVGLSLTLAGTRPPDYAPRALLDGFMVIVLYLMVPNRFILQCIPAWILTAGSLWQVFTHMTLDPASLRSVLVLFAFANIFGGWTAWRSHVDRRSRFAQWMEERRLREALEQQRERSRQLEGLLPICSTCKSIRDDEGYWRKVEQYLGERTDALLTHGICPDCEAKAYARLEERRL